MRRLILIAALLAPLWVACGDDDDKPRDTSTGTDAQGDATTGDTSGGDTGGTVPTDDDTSVTPDGDASPTTPDGADGDTTQPQQTFATYVIDLIATSPDNEAPRAYSEFQSLPDDDSPGAFESVFD